MRKRASPRRPSRSRDAHLIGSRVTVVASRNRAALGLGGTVIDETRSTLVIQAADGVKRLIKTHHTFRVGGRVVDGARLRGRPEERLKRWVRGK